MAPSKRHTKHHPLVDYCSDYAQQGQLRGSKKHMFCVSTTCDSQLSGWARTTFQLFSETVGKCVRPVQSSLFVEAN